MAAKLKKALEQSGSAYESKALTLVEAAAETNYAAEENAMLLAAQVFATLALAADIIAAVGQSRG